MTVFNARVKQLLILALIILLLVSILHALRIFIPGILGAITLYILSRENYFDIVYKRKWRKGWSAMLFLFYYLLILGVPIYFAVSLISPKLDAILSDPTGTMNTVQQAINSFQEKLDINIVNEKTVKEYMGKISAFFPTLINSTANLLTNMVLMLFLLYYMLYNGRDVEKFLFKIIPLKDRNTNLLASETKRMIKANALGIPIISIIQGAVATLGYFIFGVDNFAVWGLLTGLFAFFPVIGTIIIWAPLVLFTYAQGDTWAATGLLIYNAIVTGQVDYLARITLLRRMGNVHPILTVLGVIVGLSFFGFIGLIFGPLLVSYLVVLFKIYMNEFGNGQDLMA